jgi:hypothetical protein
MQSSTQEPQPEKVLTVSSRPDCFFERAHRRFRPWCFLLELGLSGRFSLVRIVLRLGRVLFPISRNVFPLQFNRSFLNDRRTFQFATPAFAVIPTQSPSGPDFFVNTFIFSLARPVGADII